MHGHWTEIYIYLVRPISIYLAALAVVRLMGKRALAQLSLFDLVVIAGIGDIIIVVGLERKVPILDGLVVLGILGGLEIAITLLTYQWRWAARLFEGRPTVLVRDGRLITRNMQREHISEADLEQELRKQGVDDYRAVKEAVLEACGKISVIPHTGEETALQRLTAEVAALRRDLSDLAERIGGGKG